MCQIAVFKYRFVTGFFVEMSDLIYGLVPNLFLVFIFIERVHLYVEHI